MFLPTFHAFPNPSGTQPALHQKAAVRFRQLRERVM